MVLFPRCHSNVLDSFAYKHKLFPVKPSYASNDKTGLVNYQIYPFQFATKNTYSIDKSIQNGEIYYLLSSNY
jgi:hypothetical protein